MAHISILFSWFLEYGYLPGDFTRSIVMPLVKNKSGDLTDAKNYRATMISNYWSLCYMIILLLPHLRTCTNLVLKLSTVPACVQVF